MQEEPILAKAIIEMMGAPQEYISKTLTTYVEKLKKEGIKVTKEHYAEPAEAGKFFSVFAELEIRFNNYKEVLNFCFDSMPSSIEIIEPAEMSLEAGFLTDFLNDLQARLHELDLVFKNTKAQKELLDKNALNVLRNFVKYILKESPRSAQDIAEPLGMKPEDVTPMLDKMIEQNLIKKDGELYANE